MRLRDYLGIGTRKIVRVRGRSLWGKILFSGYVRAMTPINSQDLWLCGYDLCKIKTTKISSSGRGSWVLAVNGCWGRKNQFSWGKQSLKGYFCSIKWCYTYVHACHTEWILDLFKRERRWSWEANVTEGTEEVLEVDLIKTYFMHV